MCHKEILMRDTGKRINAFFGAWVLGILVSSNLYAGMPLWSYSAPNPAQVVISSASNATVQYTVTNQSAGARNLIMKATPGLSASSCYLAMLGSTCTLTLTINASQIPDEGLHSGPILCEQGNSNQCYQPTAANRLNVTKMPAPTLSLSGSPLTLTAGGSSGTITVTNNSATITATNVVANLTGTALNGRVSQNSSQCVSLPPNQSCTLIFTPDTTAVAIPQTSFPIKGDNTLQVSGAISVILPAQASINISGSPLTLTAGGRFGFLVVRNLSNVLTATNISANLTGTALDGNVTQNAANCASVLPGHFCFLFFTPGNVAVPATTVQIQGSNTSQASASIAIVVEQAPISVTGSPLTLTAGGGSGSMTVTNNSTTITATNIVANFSGTALNGNVTQNAVNCATVAPGATCTLTFTPNSTAVSLTNFPIQGDNTTQVAGAISVEIPTQAQISVSGSPLTLRVGGSTGHLTVTNQSNVLTATNISANLTGTALDGNVTQDATNCASVSPTTSCTLNFTPGNTVVSATTVVIQGSNTSQTTAQIAINPPLPTLSITAGQSMTLNTNEVSSGWMIIHNNSTTTTANSIVPDFSGTALNGYITTTSDCFVVAPNGDCTMIFNLAPGLAPMSIPLTSFSISGTNTSQVTGNLALGIIPSGLSVGTPLSEGIIASLFVSPSGTACGTTASTLYLESATSNFTLNASWGGFGTATGATDTVDGLANTKLIVSALGQGSYAAEMCYTYQIDENGSSPCQSGVCYEGWYLPAQSELSCLYDNQVIIGGFPLNGVYWSSVEDSSAPTTDAFALGFTTNTYSPVTKSTNLLAVRCVRTITN